MMARAMGGAAPLFLPLLLAAGCSAGPGAVPVDLSAWRNKTVMFIGAHPDDIEAGSGGTAALLARQGTKLVYLIITNGDKGCNSKFWGNCSNTTPEMIAVQRAGESQRALDVVGGGTLIMLKGYDDGMLYTYSEQRVREDITLHVRREKPDVVMTWKPYPDFQIAGYDGWGDYGFHTDHQDTARHVLNVVKNAAGNAYTFPDSGLPSHGVSEFYMWDFSATATHYVDVGGVLDVKLAATVAHACQYPDVPAEAAFQKLATSRVARTLGLADGMHVEALLRF